MKLYTPILFLLFYACLGGQTGQEAFPNLECEEKISPVNLQEKTPLGLTASELFQQFKEPRTSVLQWHHYNAEDSITVFVRSPMEIAHFIDRSPEEWCQDYVEIDVTLELSTTSNFLAETILVTLRANAFDEAHINFSIPLASVQGSYNATDFDASFREGEYLDFHIFFANDREGMSGNISLQPTGEDRAAIEVASWSTD